MCTGNTLRGLDALGIDRDMHENNWSINLYIVAKNIRPQVPDNIDDSRDVGVYLASCTGWSPEFINIPMSRQTRYDELAALTVVLTQNVKDPMWVLWRDSIQRAGTMGSSLYLQIYLCPRASVMHSNGQAIAAIFSPWLMDLKRIFPEVKLSGVHRHLPLTAWYTSALAQGNWRLLLLPPILGVSILDIPEDMKSSVTDMRIAAKRAVYNCMGDDFVRSVAISRPRAPRISEHNRWHGVNIQPWVNELIETIINTRKEAMKSSG
jgi:hypothetical protein